MSLDKHILQLTTKGFDKGKKEVKGVDKSLVGMAKAAITVTAALYGAKQLLDGMKEAIRLAGIQEKAEQKLATALGYVSNELLRHASALQKNSVFGDEAIITQQAFLASLKFSEAQIKKIIPVSMDLAAATGMTLESAVRNTAKTFSGLSGELGELVPQLRALTAEEMIAGEAVEVMADLFGGQASAETNTFEGTLAQLDNTLGDVAERIGEELMPVVQAFAEQIIEIVDWVTQFDISGRESFQTYEATLGFDALTKAIKKNWENEKIRQVLLTRLREDYPQYLGNLKDEEILLEDINLLHAEGIRLFRAKMVEQVLQEYTKSATQLIVDGYIALAESEAQTGSFLKTARTAFLDLPDPLAAEGVKKIEKGNEELEKYADLLVQITAYVNELTEASSIYNQKELNDAEKRNRLQQEAIDKLEKKHKLQIELGKIEAKVFKEGETRTLEGAEQNILLELQEAKAGLIAKILTDVPFPFSLILAKGAEMIVESLFSKNNIRFAQTGADFVTDSPEMLMVGEGGRERVTVTPLEDVGYEGGGQGITLNISGNVLTDSFVEDSIVPSLREALRQGESLA